jgi:predicted transport protein
MCGSIPTPIKFGKQQNLYVSSKLKTNFFILVVNKKPRSIQLTALDLEHLQQNLVKPADMLR